MKGIIHIGGKEYMSLDEINKILKSEFKEGFTSHYATKVMQEYCINRMVRPYKREWSFVYKKLVNAGLLRKKELEFVGKGIRKYYYYYWDESSLNLKKPSEVSDES